MRKYLMFMLSFLFLLTGCVLEDAAPHADDVDLAVETSTDAAEEQTEEKEKEKAEPKESSTEKQEKTKKTGALSPLSIHYIDVGQADATLLTHEVDGEQYTVLYDTGDWTGDETVSYLQAQGITALDVVIISHPDADHIGQLPAILETFDVGEVWMTGNESSSNVFQESLERILEKDVDYHEARMGEEYDIGKLHLQVLYPKTITGKANEESLAIQFTYGDQRFLFTGDADTTAELAMIETGIDLSAHVLQLGHHGSDTSSSEAFLEAVQPEVAIFSAGVDNPYGHPHEDVISRLEKAGVSIYGTAPDGNILLTTDGKSYSIQSEKQTRSKPIQAEKQTDSKAAKEDARHCININEASIEELQEIVHIGEKRAAEVIANRPYDKIDELTKINGIHDERVQDIQDEGMACVE